MRVVNGKLIIQLEWGNFCSFHRFLALLHKFPMYVFAVSILTHYHSHKANNCLQTSLQTVPQTNTNRAPASRFINCFCLLIQSSSLYLHHAFNQVSGSWIIIIINFLGAKVPGGPSVISHIQNY